MEQDKESGYRRVSPLPLFWMKQQWVCGIIQFPIAVLCASWMIFLDHVIWPYCSIISEYHATAEIRTMFWWCYVSRDFISRRVTHCQTAFLYTIIRASALTSWLQVITLNNVMKSCRACFECWGLGGVASGNPHFPITSDTQYSQDETYIIFQHHCLLYKQTVQRALLLLCGREGKRRCCRKIIVTSNLVTEGFSRHGQRRVSRPWPETDILKVLRFSLTAVKGLRGRGWVVHDGVCLQCN